ncbi:Ubiquitin-conjugating enzyme E2 11 [Ascosphaera pollenicola]|nr:Ubiquitin-conjugating enzyme E2 11 [Ascosphaera pollenicola]
MAPPTTSITAISAPGKVLLTGGYLVLDRNYNGLVLALDARIHAIVRQVQKTPREEEDQSPETSSDTITVRSPQFIDAKWAYTIEKLPNNGGVQASQVGDGPRNPFVETALSYALTYASQVTGSTTFGTLDIIILADNDYYSETETSRESKDSRFANFGVKLQDAHKTGLGSSAALVTSLASAVVLHHAIQAEDLLVVRNRLHNLAQAAHCAAQGKIGSGFDIAAAVYGSCRYRRFSPSILENLGDFGSDGFAERLFAIVEDVRPETPWDTEINDIGLKLPRFLQMVLCDVDCGSQTPGMVRKVLQWRKDCPEEAERLWDELQRCNDHLREEIINSGSSKERVASYSSRPPTTSSNENQRAQSTPLNVSSIVHSQQQQQQQQPPQSHSLSQESLQANGNPNFSTIAEAISRIRYHLRSMTARAEVPIEPPAQSQLLDSIIESVDGVVGGVVPGAGGYDAIALLVHSDINVLKSLRTFLSNWEKDEAAHTADEFGGKIERVKLLNVVHGSEGMKHEKELRTYAAWLE